MPTKDIDSHIVEFTGELLEGSGQWGAFVSISVPSHNPMHMTIVYAKRRVSPEATFEDQHAAEAEAERAASTILEELRA
jgi:hypothetical protein